jgi:hypothetical protein
MPVKPIGSTSCAQDMPLKNKKDAGGELPHDQLQHICREGYLLQNSFLVSHMWRCWQIYSLLGSSNGKSI